MNTKRRIKRKKQKGTYVVKDRHVSHPEMEEVYSSEAPENFYHATHHHNEEDVNFQ